MVRLTGWKKIRDDRQEIIYKSRTTEGFRTLGMFRINKGAMSGKWWTYLQTGKSAKPQSFPINMSGGTSKKKGQEYLIKYMRQHPHG